MTVADLSRLDLNLLVAFDTIMQTRSVTKAAEQTGVTQSAMSHTLRRLRELFEDPLLVRVRGGMALTPRAEALAIPLRGALSELSRVISTTEEFSPQRYQGEFKMVSPDLFDLLVLPPLLTQLAHQAPGMKLAMLPMSKFRASALETQELDLAIVPVLLGEEAENIGMSVPPDFKRRTLFEDSFHCFLRKAHPQLPQRRLTLKKYTELKHLLVSPSGAGPGVVDAFLARKNLARSVVLRVPHFSTALAVVTRSDLMLTAPSALVQVLGADGAIETWPAPIALPKHAVTMVWHPRFDKDPAHCWMRERLVEVTKSLPRRAGGRRRSKS